MDFYTVLDQVVALLRQRGRASYRALKREFQLDDEYLEDLKEELIGAQRLAVDEEGRFLVWVGGTPLSSTSAPVISPALATPSSQSSDARPQALYVRRSDGERRQLTVQFIDLVGSTALSQQLDPEEYREVIQAYRETCAAVIRRFEGYLAKYIGDGLLVYFGYPQAHEDDAPRAVRAGLGIVAALPQLNARLQSTLEAHKGTPLQVRIGIHTGLVVAGEMGVGDQPEPLGIVGETPNIAARLQEQAAPNSIVISPTTYRLVTGLVECQELGPHELKGLAQPLVLYQVVGESAAQSRFEAAVHKGLTPLVGRAEELAVLQRRWEQAKAGAGQVVLLSGEAGIGKSRLVDAFKETVEHEGARCLALHCSPYHQNSALYPVIEHLQRGLQFQHSDPPDEKLRKLVGEAQRSLPLQAETIPLLAALLSLPHPEGSPPLTLSPQKQKEKTYEVLIAWLCAEATQQAVTYAWEDLHWVDPSTLEFLMLLLAQVPTTRMLAVLTFRPEFTAPWGLHSSLSQLTLSRLGHPQVEVMVEKITGGKTLPREVVQQVASKTDGVPLFVEELTKMVMESDLVTEVNGHYELNGPLPPLAIPSTLQDSLMARLDRLAPVREIAQIGATIGREFDYTLLQAVGPLNEDLLQQGLKQLVEAELVYQSGVPPQARYFFKHALIRDTAYHSLLKSTRQQYHSKIAQVLADRFPETIEMQPELLAYHYTEAGLSEQAIAYWQQAGQRAIQRSANLEAISHLTRGLAGVPTLPDTAERTQHELLLLIALGIPLQATKGIGAREVETTYLRALELCQQIGETPLFFSVMTGLATVHLLRAEYHETRALAEQLLQRAREVNVPLFLVGAHGLLGIALYFLGELVPARTHLEQGMALYDPQWFRFQTALMPQEPGVPCLGYLTNTLWLLGYPEQALQRNREVVTLAHDLARPFSEALALWFVAKLYAYRREVHMVREQVETLIALSIEQGFAQWVGAGMELQGIALIEQGAFAEGLTLLRRSRAAIEQTGQRLGLTMTSLALAQGYGKAGQAREGERVVAEALTFVETTGERACEAELYRLKGELTLQTWSGARSQWSVIDLHSPTPSPQAEAEACYLKAIEIARQQQAKSWELRATLCLARLWQQQGKRAEAHKMLADVYNWFTEGFDTKDLQEAKALLNTLAEGA